MQGTTPAGQMSPILEEFRSLLDRPLLPHQARRLESLAVSLGVKLEWQWIDLNENEWKNGRAPHHPVG